MYICITYMSIRFSWSHDHGRNLPFPWNLTNGIFFVSSADLSRVWLWIAWGVAIHRPEILIPHTHLISLVLVQVKSRCLLAIP